MSWEAGAGILRTLGEGVGESPGETDPIFSVISQEWALNQRESRVTGVGHGAID